MGWGDLAEKVKARAAADEAFLKQYHCSPNQYITNAKKRAVTPAAVENRRSSDGKEWMQTPPAPEHKQPSINGYHQLEEKAKESVRAGNIPSAIQLLEDANQVQTAYENKQFGGADAAHQASKTFRLARQNSLRNIHQKIIAADPDVAKAKLDVQQFFAKYNITLDELDLL